MGEIAEALKRQQAAERAEKIRDMVQTEKEMIEQCKMWDEDVKMRNEARKIAQREMKNED